MNLAELGLEKVADEVYVRPMLTINRAIDLYLSDLTVAGRGDSTRRTYGRYLDKFADTLPDDWDVAKITDEDIRRFLDHYRHHAGNTRFQVWSVLNGFFRFLAKAEKIKRSPIDRIAAPRKPDPLTLEVVTVSGEQVTRLLAAARTWTEKLSVAIPVYTGCRRRAAALLRVKHYDREQGLLRFREKGGKVIWKPVPDELAVLLDASILAKRSLGWDPSQSHHLGWRDTHPDDYLIPAEKGGSQRRLGERDERIVWKAVKRAAKRAGMREEEVHAHALRAAFAVAFDDANPGLILPLKDLMGHKEIATTEIYLRRRNKQRGMEPVRGLSWVGNRSGLENPENAGDTIQALPVTEKEGFEPSIPTLLREHRQGGHPVLVDLLGGVRRVPEQQP